LIYHNVTKLFNKILDGTGRRVQIFSRKRKIVLSPMALLLFIMTTIVMLLDTLPPVDLLPNALPLNTLLLIIKINENKCTTKIKRNEDIRSLLGVVSGWRVISVSITEKK